MRKSVHAASGKTRLFSCRFYKRHNTVTCIPNPTTSLVTSDDSHLPPTRVSKLEAIPHCGPLTCKMRFSFPSGLLGVAYAFA